MRAFHGLVLLLLLAPASPAVADGDPLAALEHVGGDPLEVARVVRGLDTDAVLRALAQGEASVRGLALIRGAPFVAAPHLALEPLASIMAGRDSVLAPAAALSVMRIVESQDAESLRAAEVMASEWLPARRALAALVDATHVRADIRAVAAAAVGACDDWFGPLPEPPKAAAK